MAPGTPKTPKILVVDDHEANRLLYTSALREIPDVEIVEAANGRDALDLTRQGGFAVYLLDVHMPDMDGYELASLLRQRSDEPIPIVFVTTDDNARRQSLLRGYRMGATDFVALGPLRTEILTQKARFFVRMWRRRQELARDMEAVREENQQLQEKLAEYKRKEQVLRAQATHDVLTQLPNRVLFQDRLKAAIARARRNRQRMALAYVDLDGFKDINDRHGHGAGDALLVSVGNRLLRAVRETDTVARVGGDEFVLLLEALDSPAGAEYVALKAYAALTQPLLLLSEALKTELKVQPGASMGVAIYPDHSAEPDELIRLADMTMYDAKRGGGGLRIHGAEKRPEAFAPLQLIRARQETRNPTR